MVELTHFDMVQNAWKCWLLSCVWLCDPMDCNPPGSSVRGILQARILEWVAIPFSRGSSWPRDQTWVSCTVGRFFTLWATKSRGFKVLPPGASLKIEKFFTWGREILFHCMATVLFTYSKNVLFCFFYYSGCGVTRPVDSSDPGPYPHWILAE